MESMKLIEKIVCKKYVCDYMVVL